MHIRQAEAQFVQAPAMAARRSAWWAEGAALLAAALLCGLLALLNLRYYPTISGWDEGMYLQFATNWLRHGEYATRSAGVFERLQPVGGTGPTLIVPVGLALWLGGQDLVAARLVMILFMFATLLGIYALLRRISGWPAAVAALLLFLTAGYQMYDTLWLGRQVLAEMPEFAFFFLGLWAWLASWGGRQRWLWVSAGLFALAVVSKNQLILILGPAFVLMAAADWLYYRQLRLWHYALPLAGSVLGYVGWTLVSLWIVGADERARYLSDQRALTAATFLHVGLRRWIDNLRLLYSSGQWWSALPAILYGLWTARARSADGLRRLMLPLFAAVALASFVAMGITMPRYIHPALALGALCMALLLGDLICWVGSHARLGWPGAVGVGALALALLAGPRVVQNFDRISLASDQHAEQFAEQLSRALPAHAAVVNWEWELEFYIQHDFIHPPHRLFSAMMDQAYNQYTDPVLDQRRIPAAAEYVIVGPFASQTHAFDAELDTQPHTLVVSDGPYQLYQLTR